MKTTALILILQLFAFSSWAYDFIQVSGEGEVKVKPDYILVSTTVFSRAQTAQAAQKLNAKEMARVEKILKQDFKIEAKDLQTSSFQVQPQYDYAKEKPIYRGMSVTHSLKVKFRKVEEVGSLLDRLVSGESSEGFGVRIDDINFGTDQMKEYQVRALEQAMAEAKLRAHALAKTSGRGLSVIRKISDSEVQENGFHPVRSLGKMAAMDMASESAPSQIAAGELSIKAQVQVEFEIK